MFFMVTGIPNHTCMAPRVPGTSPPGARRGLSQDPSRQHATCPAVQNPACWALRPGRVCSVEPWHNSSFNLIFHSLFHVIFHGLFHVVLLYRVIISRKSHPINPYVTLYTRFHQVFQHCNAAHENQASQMPTSARAAGGTWPAEELLAPAFSEAGLQLLGYEYWQTKPQTSGPFDPQA